MTSPPSQGPGPDSIAGVITSAGSAIGQYFNLASFIPSIALALWTYMLVAAGSITGPPDPSRLPDALSITPESVTGLILSAIFLGLLLHPLQFGLTQILEGYWGTNRIGVALAAARINRYRGRVRHLKAIAVRHRRRVAEELAERRGLPLDKLTDRATGKLTDLAIRQLNPEVADDLIRHYWREQEAIRQGERFPVAARRIMATELGNALRAFEDSAGTQYGIEGTATAAHFPLISDPNHVAYVQDAQQSMDVSIRLWLIGILATIESIAFLATDGLWLLTALIPYTASYVAYRGAVAAARGYGVAVKTMIDLNRFALYDALHVRRPTSVADEKELNRALANLFRGEDVDLPYRKDA